MVIHNIPFESFIPHGKVTVSSDNGELHMTGGSDRNAYIEIPSKFNLPFRIDMTAKIDSPALILQIGEGYINLNTGGMDNRRMMSIVGGETKPNIHKFDNSLPLNEYFDISVIYGKKAMQLTINGEERYFNKKDVYMKSPSADADFQDGFGLKIACHKRTEVYIKSLTVTEYTDEPALSALPKKDFIYAPTLTPTDKPTLEDCIKDLSLELKDCIYDIDKSLKELKFKRKIEGGYPESKITYIISKVVSYQIKISHHLMTHRTMAVLGNHTDNFNEIFLNRLDEINSDFAEEIFFRMQEGHCTHCIRCANYRLTEYKGNTNNNCQHIVQFKMIASDFGDVRKVIDMVIHLSKNL